MSSLQFPPSSPVLGGSEPLEHLGKPKSFKLPARGRTEYPTPNPSSTAGRSSSPARNGVDEPEVDMAKSVHFDSDLAYSSPIEPPVGQGTPVAATSELLRQLAAPHPRKVSINRDFNILNPHAEVLRVPLLSTRTSLTIGRSSKSSDYSFRPVAAALDKSISRMHVRVSYYSSNISIECLGYNGLGMIVPRVCHVSKINESAYELRETGKPLVAHNVSKTIHADYQHTEFHVSRQETVVMPRFPNVLLQIGSHTLLLNPDDCDEELTDDETTEVQKPVIFPVSDAVKETITPQVFHSSLPDTPKKAHFRHSSEEPTPSRSKFDDKENKGLKAMTKSNGVPLGEKSLNALNKRRAQSEEPVSAKRTKKDEKREEKEHKEEKEEKKDSEHDADGKLIINEQCIANVANRSEIENILINHLAFSRLSSTPASFLNTVSVAVAKLTLQQLRAIVHKAPCIGVIYRSGKDAAGKPLEEEYYYMPEHDSDPERNQLVSSIKGHGGLRACRRTHKQYYWKKPSNKK